MGEQELKLVLKKNTKKILKNLLNGPNDAEHVVWAVFVLRSTDVCGGWAVDDEAEIGRASCRERV